MKVHHVNCATMCPPLGKLAVNRSGFMVCHCLIIESSDGLVLVDTGIGVAEHEDPRRLLGLPFVTFANPRREPHLAMLRQVEALGFKASDVRHIIPTHLDLDHAGGIPDFPAAKVHIYQREHDAAIARATRMERGRYKPHQWERATFAPHAANGQGDTWFGFSSVRPIAGLEIALVPLVGHTRGHCGVAVRATTGWLLHCGDAYFHAQEMSPTEPSCPLALRVFQRLIAMDNAARVHNQQRLRELARDHGGEVRLFCAHDPSELEAIQVP
jgi:glyoxylase-like metal-dependent hydrolase (beta-lactamase superfamily II)